MTDTLKQLVTIIYLDSKPEHEKIKDKIEIKRLERQLHTQQLDYNSRRNVEDRISSLKNQDYWPGYSYDDLAVIFDLSKATVHESVRQKKIEIKQLLEKPNLRKEARALALEELKQEEKLKLLHEKPKGN